jgi:hypothetical protein
MSAWRALTTVMARGFAADAAPKNQGGPLTVSHPERKTAMLQESMVLPATNGKSRPPQKSGKLYSDTNGQRERRARAWFQDRLQHARSAGVFSETATLDPVLAEVLLECNLENRNVRELNLARMEEDIKAGRWEINGESVKVSIEGLLNDGQHRCQAVINTGKSIQTIFTFGLKRDTRLTVDQGANRTAGDYLSMAGIPNANHAASVATMIYQIGTFGNIVSGGAFRPSKSQAQQTYYEHPKISDSIRAVPQRGAKLVGGLSILAFCHYLFALKNRNAADAFVSKLVKGDELKASDPIYVARQKLMNDDKRLRPAEKVEVIFRAWNAARTGRPLRTIPVHNRLPSIEN